MARARLLLPVLLALSLGACGSNEGALAVAAIDTPDSLFADGVRLSAGAQHVRAATDAGLVALDAQGEVIPALADRWIVTDDGRSFIFRLRDGTWPDGRDLTAESARAALNDAIRALDGTSLGLDLEPIAEVRAMAGRVIEIRLSSPVPMLLQLLAQPELALRPGDGGSGDMELRRDGATAILTMKRPAARGIPEAEDWAQYVRQIELHAASAERAVALFDDGEVDLVLGGRIGALPLADTGPLSRGTVQLDPALGLFGLRVRRAEGLLATPLAREAIAMALDRPALVGPFNIGGWVPTTRIVPPGLPGDPGQIGERWSGRTIDELRAVAAGRIAAWRRANGGAEARLTLALDRAPGLDMLFAELATQLATIGVRLERAPPGRAADLELVDRVARYADPRWFLNQFNCSLRGGLCHSQADRLVRESDGQADPAERAAMLAEAEAELTLANLYIPFGSPLRFSLVRGNVEGFAANPWAFHPLPPLAKIAR
ncbi:MAG TPA: ABC transporter substrate-binding protein [Croceibacterium sp.]|nr:ABC transporter substrate-binding protein [Croceibacterium sp.]